MSHLALAPPWPHGSVRKKMHPTLMPPWPHESATKTKVRVAGVCEEPHFVESCPVAAVFCVSGCICVAKTIRVGFARALQRGFPKPGACNVDPPPLDTSCEFCC